jgi:hypothetical protein
MQNTVILVGFQSDFNFVDIHSKYPQITNLMKILPVGAELFMWTDGGMDKQTDRQTDLTKLIFAFRHL